MKFKKSLLLLGLAILAFAYNSVANSTIKGFTIKAESNIEPNTLVYLSKVTDTKLVMLDTTRVSAKGQFQFEGDATEESLLHYITFNKEVPPGIPLVIESGAKLEFDIDKGKVIKFSVSGGKHNESMARLHDLYTSFDLKMLNFNEEVSKISAEEATDQMRNDITKRYNELVQGREKEIETFIEKEPGSPVTYFAVKYLFQRPVPRLILKGSEKLEAEFPGTVYATQLKKEADILGPTIEGREAPELNLVTPEGDSLALSSLRGKVVLIDFWASWCGPCRKENPHVKAIYEKYKDKGFEIYGVSLDNNMRQWQAAIAKDGLTWNHVSDLKGWRSSAAKLYGVRSIPQTFLIDQDGRIIKSGLRSGDLEPLLESILN